MARLNFLGYVISQGKMEKTIKVRILQKKFDKKVQKHFLQKKDYLVHDEGNICREGDLVRIEQTRPLSATKYFAVAEIKKNKGQQFATYQKEAKQQVKDEEIRKLLAVNTKKEILNKNLGETLYKDMNYIKELKDGVALTDEQTKKIEEIKEKYNLTNVEKNEKKEFMQTSIGELSNTLEQLSSDIQLTIALNNIDGGNYPEEKKIAFEKLFEKLSIDENTQKNIRKNKLRKFLLNSTNEDLKELGIKLEK